MKTQQKGFTIIEVVLVLAIAGLIFLMVFIALPALQRSQRDTQRRDDVSRFISQMNSYATNNNGKIPTTAAELTTFKTSYLKWDADANISEFNDPKSGEPYTIAVQNNGSRTIADGTIDYLPGFKCSGETATSGAGTRSGAVRVKLEGSGVFCEDNQ